MRDGSNDADERRERFVPALRSGGRYVWHEPVVRRILLRAGMFIAPAMVLWALLPLVARDQLGLGPGGYGALFGALGVGAITGAQCVADERLPRHLEHVVGAADKIMEAVLVAAQVDVRSFDGDALQHERPADRIELA